MNTIRRLIYREVLSSIGFVTLGFLGLFFFFDVVDELQLYRDAHLLEMLLDDLTEEQHHVLASMITPYPPSSAIFMRPFSGSRGGDACSSTAIWSSAWP